MPKKMNLSEMMSSNMETIIEEIEDDHEDLRKFIKILKDEEADTKKRKAAYTPFAELLKSHASSEEKAVYEVCLKIEDLKEKAHESFVEHIIAENLMKKIPGIRDEAKWLAHAKVLAELVEHHMEEEESSFLPALKKHVEEQKQEQMAEKFLTLRQKSQRGFSKENGGVLART